ncbi:MAG: flagellar export protein FliJ [Candidatus Latescibacterota bacterium]
MRRFTFRFQRVLELRLSIEEARKAALGEAMASLYREQQVLAELEETRRRYQEAARLPPGTPLYPGLLALGAAYLQRLRREMEEQRGHIARAEQVVEDRRRRLAEARRERRVFEILRDKAWGEHLREEKRRQGRQLDEVGQQLYHRQEAAAARYEAASRGV